MRSVDIKRAVPDGQPSEELKSVAVNIQFCGADKKAVMLTRCTVKEGMGSEGLLLACAMAELGKKTLLLDADLRTGALAAALDGNGTQPGLAQYLAGQAELEDVKCASGVPGLELIPAGAQPSNPIELLSTERFQKAVAACREQYDYVIVDAPPMDGYVDAMLVGSACDGAVLLLRSGKVSRKVAKASKAKLARSGCPLLGVVLDGVDKKKRKHAGLVR